MLRRWPLCALDVKKAFLQGVSYEELAAETGEVQREVNFELPASTAAVLQQVPGYEDFDHRLEVLHCDKPGTGLRDAPRAFSRKLRKVTDEIGFQGTTADPELEFRCVPSDKSGDQGHYSTPKRSTGTSDKSGSSSTETATPTSAQK